MKKLLLFAIVILGFSAVSFGQTASATAASSATIIAPLTIVNNASDGLLFGNIIANAAIGTVVVTPGATATVAYTGVKAPVGLAGTIQAAKFTVKGMEGSTYTITKGAAFDVIHSVTTTEKMNVSGITTLPAATGTLDSNGDGTIYVGATLNVKASQLSGLYQSTNGLTVTVNYN